MELFGDLFDVFEYVSLVMVIICGLYVGVMLLLVWNEWVIVGDFGYCSKVVFIWYLLGIMVECVWV